MFQLKEHNTTVRTEMIAGLTTFMTMVYILMVNASMFTDIVGAPVSYGAMYISTAISCVVGSVLIGLLAGLPLAQAPSMGLNAFFVYTICDAMGFTYANALAMVLLDGVLFVVLTLTGLRRIVFEAIPKAVKAAISAGIGLFISFIGMQNSGMIVKGEFMLIDLHSFNILYEKNTWPEIMPIVITVITVVLIAVLNKKKVRGGVFWSIIAATVLYYVLMFVSVPGFKLDFSMHAFQPFDEFFSQCFMKVFTEGFDFSAYIASNGMGNFVVALISGILAMCLVDMFGTIGTLYGACTVSGIVDENGDIPHMERAMLADAVATCIGAICGTSTVTTYVESSAGIAEGGRTGLTAVFTGAFFFIAMFFAPFAAIIPSCATAPVLIYIGIMMMESITAVDWNNIEEALPAFFTITIMTFGNNISYGIAFGLITYILMKCMLRKVKDINIGTWVIGLLFLIMFFVSR